MKARLTQRSCLFLLFILSVFLVFFRARWAFQPGPYDEACYIKWLHRLLFLDYPECYSRSHTAGLAVTWLPVGVFARLVSAVTPVSFIELVLLLISFQSFILWGISLFLIDRLLQKWPGQGERSAPVWLPIALLLNVPFLLYSARINFCTSPAEMVLCLCFFLCALENRFLTSVLVGGLLVWMRINDAPIFFVLPGMMADAYRRGSWTPAKRELQLWGALVVAAMAVALYCVYRVGFVSGYNGIDIPTVIRAFSWERIHTAFFTGSDGIVFTSLWWLCCLGLGLFWFTKLSWTARASAIWMLLELGLVVGLNGIRDDYTTPVNRYLHGSYIGAFIIWLETAPRLQPNVRKGFVAVLLVFAFWIPYQMYTYDGIRVNALLGAGLDWFSEGHILNRLTFLMSPLALVKMLAFSPVGFVMYSFFWDSPMLAPLVEYQKYALRGAQLVALVIASTLAVFAFFYLLWLRPRLPKD